MAGYEIVWHTARVHLTEDAHLVLTVKVEADNALLAMLGEAEPNPIWREQFDRLAGHRLQEWRKRQLHWGKPSIDQDGTVKVAPIDGSTSEAEILRGELEDLVKHANDSAGDAWERLKSQADELTKLFQSGR
jgi:hypothetical protein